MSMQFEKQSTNQSLQKHAEIPGFFLRYVGFIDVFTWRHMSIFAVALNEPLKATWILALSQS